MKAPNNPNDWALPYRHPLTATRSMYDWFLMDRWDRLLGELGRALGCDTLFYTASTWGVHQAVPTGEARVGLL